MKKFLILAMLAGTLSACNNPVQDPCQVNPTRTTSDGSWVEADGEPLDSDPCDADDMRKKKKRKSTRK